MNEYDREFQISATSTFFPAARNTFFLQSFPDIFAASQSRPVIPGDPTDPTWRWDDIWVNCA